MNTMRQTLGTAAICLALLGCKEKEVDASGEDSEAEVGEMCGSVGDDDTVTCAAGLACEAAPDVDGDGEPDAVCAHPLEVRGQVFDAQTGDPIEGARVAALDETGAPVSNIAISGPAGAYTLTVPARRDASGELADALKWTLFVTAQDYLPFPAGVRPAIPIDAREATPSEGDGADGDETAITQVIENATTDVALLVLPEDQRGGRTISGVVGRTRDDADDHDDDFIFDGGGTLVVAEGTQRASYAIADASGEYVLFNVPAQSVEVVGYRSGLAVTPVRVEDGGDIEAVNLQTDDEASARLPSVTGSVSLVNAPGSAQTSVVLVPVSVYNAALERGPVPLGLRAPKPPEGTTITGAFAIEGVPDGTYKVLAAFENDDLVRDPDTNIAGTDIPEVSVGGAETTLSEGFKVTEHLAVVSPGATGPEVVDGSPTFVFADDSSEDRYEVVVFDAFGELVWSKDDVDRVTGSGNVEVPYEGPALEPGMYYQFRATSWRDRPNDSGPISRTEDLRGVFVAAGGGSNE